VSAGNVSIAEMLSMAAPRRGCGACRIVAFVGTVMPNEKPRYHRGLRLLFFGCAGAQLEFSAEQDRGVADVWLPFEEDIAVDWA
jgi:hypothetical protein